MMKKILSLLPALSLVLLVASCMDDPITGYEAEPRPIYRPSSVAYTFLDYSGGTTGDIEVRWRRSVSDTQLNFAGYMVRLYKIDTVIEGTKPRTVVTKLDEKMVDKAVFSTVFANVPIMQPYAVAVWGQRYSSPDTLIVSRDSMAQEFFYDPRPIDNPTVARAAAIGPTGILLEWDLPATHAQGNVLSYAIYLRDPSNVDDTFKVVSSKPFGINEVKGTDQIQVPPATVVQGMPVEKEYEFRIMAIRKDSSFGKGTPATIRWSGGERFAPQSAAGSTSEIKLGMALFVGNVQGRFGAQEIAPDNQGAWMKFEDSNGDVLVTGLNGVRFYTQVDATKGLDTAVFSRPLELNEYTEASLTLPRNAPPGNGWTIYARQTSGNESPLRLRFFPLDTTSIVRNDAVSLEMIFQPPQTPTLPYF